jgi:hypothetical protein
LYGAGCQGEHGCQGGAAGERESGERGMMQQDGAGAGLNGGRDGKSGAEIVENAAFV